MYDVIHMTRGEIIDSSSLNSKGFNYRVCRDMGLMQSTSKHMESNCIGSVGCREGHDCKCINIQ